VTALKWYNNPFPGWKYTRIPATVTKYTF